MIDFSKLCRLTQEERDALSQQRDREYIESDLKERASLSVSRQQITLIDEPYIYSNQYGEMTAIITGRSSSGKQLKAILKSMANEETEDFSKRTREINSGDVISVDGYFKTRNWKNGEGKWNSSEEFHVGVVRSPDSLAYVAPEGVSMPKSAFEIQNERASQAQAMSR